MERSSCADTSAQGGSIIRRCDVAATRLQEYRRQQRRIFPPLVQRRVAKGQIDRKGQHGGGGKAAGTLIKASPLGEAVREAD